MTKKEAIERLTYIKTHDTDPEDYELFDFAIKALEKSEVKGDLISREALKEEVNKKKVVGRFNTLLLIDNAPTVEPCYQTTSCLDCGNYDKENHNCPRYCEVIKEAINSRPQGENMEFAKWVTKMIFDNGVEDFDFDLFSELACRKLEQMGLVEKVGSRWMKKGEE